MISVSFFLTAIDSAKSCIQAFFIFNQKGEVSSVVLSLSPLCNKPMASGSHIQTVSGRLQVVFRFIYVLTCLTLHRRSIADVFRIQVVSNSDVRSPIITLGSTSFFHVRVNNLYVVCVTKCVI